mmetsp:Transcript_33276/g.103732  ORF Transcript_33276/g.103732 Transcript_33276/m.103732 type:complete len:195 (+) Transcript_33276:64-648(+)
MYTLRASRLAAKLARPCAVALGGGAAWHFQFVSCEDRPLVASPAPRNAARIPATAADVGSQAILPVVLDSTHLKVDVPSREALLRAVEQQGGEVIAEAPPELRADRSLVLAAVRRGGSALRFASPELRGDRAVVIEAVKSEGLALEFAAEELRGDRAVVLEAVRQTGWALQFASDDLREDSDLLAESAWRTGGF